MTLTLLAILSNVMQAASLLVSCVGAVFAAYLLREAHADYRAALQNGEPEIVFTRLMRRTVGVICVTQIVMMGLSVITLALPDPLLMTLSPGMVAILIGRRIARAVIVGVLAWASWHAWQERQQMMSLLRVARDEWSARA